MTGQSQDDTTYAINRDEEGGRDRETDRETKIRNILKLSYLKMIAVINSPCRSTRLADKNKRKFGCYLKVVAVGYFRQR